MNKYVVFNADDFGIAPEVNDAITRSHTHGILTSTSLLANCQGFTDAVKKAKKFPKLGVGAHLSLTWGSAVYTKYPSLVTSKGYFNSDFIHIGYISFSKKIQEEIHLEFDAQIQRIIQAGIHPDHINGQHHIHMLPAIFPIVEQLARKYHIPYIRIPKEPLWLHSQLLQNIPKWLVLRILCSSKYSPIGFRGIVATGNMNLINTWRVLKKIDAPTEILLHPGPKHLLQHKIGQDLLFQHAEKYLTHPNRYCEFKTLTNDQTTRLIKKLSIIPVTFKQLANLL